PNTLRLVQNGHRFSPFYDNGLSNHLPMAVAALDGLGASDAEISAFAEHYEKILEPLPPPTGDITERTAADFLGRRAAVTSWILFFRAQIASAGRETTTRLWLRKLMPGVGSVAFHGLLRLAYAVEIGDDAELAHALAQWAADNMTLGALPDFDSPGKSPSAALALLDGGKGRYPGGNIVERMKNVAAEPGFAAVVASAGVRELSTASLAPAMLSAYRATGSFTVLHAVTACHAFRLLTPLMNDAAEGTLYLWQALACAYISAGGPKSGAPLKGDEGLPWERIARLAAVARDEHDVKLVFTCRREFDFYGDDAYRKMASAYMSSR
ncbi:MAG: questin oxidase family protein, partial [Elusimicrobiota bacterium]